MLVTDMFTLGPCETLAKQTISLGTVAFCWFVGCAEARLYQALQFFLDRVDGTTEAGDARAA